MCSSDLAQMVERGVECRQAEREKKMIMIMMSLKIFLFYLFWVLARRSAARPFFKTRQAKSVKCRPAVRAFVISLLSLKFNHGAFFFMKSPRGL